MDIVCYMFLCIYRYMFLYGFAYIFRVRYHLYCQLYIPLIVFFVYVLYW